MFGEKSGSSFKNNGIGPNFRYKGKGYYYQKNLANLLKKHNIGLSLCDA